MRTSSMGGVGPPGKHKKSVIAPDTAERCRAGSPPPSPFPKRKSASCVTSRFLWPRLPFTTSP
jgi:hypothetical protein